MTYKERLQTYQGELIDMTPFYKKLYRENSKANCISLMRVIVKGAIDD